MGSDQRTINHFLVGSDTLLFVCAFVDDLGAIGEADFLCGAVEAERAEAPRTSKQL